MCYDLAYLTKRAEKYAKMYDILVEDVEELQKKVGPTYHTSGFEHPELPVFTNNEPERLQLFTWGLIPFWVKDAASATKLSRQTLNARGETVFEKPAFRSSLTKRCLIVVDGYFEHHHYKGKAYPFFIKMKNDSPFTLAGVWETWKYQDILKNTVSIVTTNANPLMAKIHNNPKGADNQRMPLIIPKELEKEWLRPIQGPVDKQIITELIKAYDEEELVAYTVPRLRGKEAIGNKPEACHEVSYEELVF